LVFTPVIDNRRHKKRRPADKQRDVFAHVRIARDAQ
jgi:hypothetical protein